MDPRVPPVHPQQALAVYAEPLATGRRVVVFADPATGLLDRLEELGAETVVLLTPDDDLDELRAARFDLAIVADLGLFADPATLLRHVRRMLGETGAALIASPNGGSNRGTGAATVDYYALFDLVAREFADVRMIAQLPFHGVALAEVGEADESPAVSVDTQLADGDRAPEAFLALASQRGTRLDPYAIIELSAPLPAPVDHSELHACRADLAHADARLVEARAHADRMRVQLEERDVALVALMAEARRSVELESELAARVLQLAALSAELEAARAEAAAGRIAAAELEQLIQVAEESKSARSQVEPELARAAEAHAAELLRFEETLRERAQAIRSLEGEVARRERIVRELVAALEDHSVAPPSPVAPKTEVAGTRREDSSTEAALTAENGALRARLDALARDLAHREAESHSSAWTIGELERKLAQDAAPARPVGGDDSGARLSAALDELDALRAALVLEHEARARAESGEELKRAREEIARQALQLEQLGQKLAMLGVPPEMRT